MKTVLHLLNTGSFSGAENVAITIINEIKKQYPEEYKLIYVSPGGPIEQVLDRYNIDYKSIERISRSEIQRIEAESRPSLIHAHDFTASVYSAMFFTKTPIISHLHNNPPWIKKINAKTIVYAITCLKYKKMLGVSGSVFEEYAFGSLFRKKETVIGNPIDVCKVREQAKNAMDNDSFDIVFVGRLTSQKNPCKFVEIVNAVRKTHPNIKAAIIGDGELKERLFDIICQYGLQKNVILKGFMDNPFGIIKESRIMCMPSSWEGYGLAAVEALSLGCPVVASPVGGLKTIVTNNCGRLCDSDEDFSKEICSLLDDNDYYKQKAEGALLRAEELNNIERYISTIIDIYSQE